MTSSRLVCPTCNTAVHVRLVRTAPNILFYLANAIYSYNVRSPLGRRPWLFTVRFKCRLCRRVFTPVQSLDESIVCGRCGYNLTGNLSGQCPECGTPLSGRAKSRLATFRSPVAAPLDKDNH